jgi:hypothetical protein
MIDTLIIATPNEPGGMGAFDNQDEVEIIEPYCPLCKSVKFTENIKICDDCKDIFDPDNQTWERFWRDERERALQRKIDEAIVKLNN